MNAAPLAEWFGSLPVDQAEIIKLDFAVAIDNAIKSLNLSRKDVAEILQTSPAWVTKVLRGDINLTIESMAKLCNAVGQDLQIKVVAKNAATSPNQWEHNDAIHDDGPMKKTPKKSTLKVAKKKEATA